MVEHNNSIHVLYQPKNEIKIRIFIFPKLPIKKVKLNKRKSAKKACLTFKMKTYQRIFLES